MGNLQSINKETFRKELGIALSELRDIVRLRTMTLADVLVPDVPHAQKGWELSRFLLEAVSNLQPETDDGEDSWPARRHSILTLRYVNNLSPDEVADRLAIGRRHCYRQLRRALDELADSIWATVNEESVARADDNSRDSELLHRESDLLLDSPQQASLLQVSESILSILSPLCLQRSVRLDFAIPPVVPEVSLSPQILKQFLLGLVGGLLTDRPPRRISVTARVMEDGLSLIIKGEGYPASAGHQVLAEAAVLEKTSTQLAMLQGARVEQMETKQGSVAYRATFPIARASTVLVVDDNKDVCLLLRRYLTSGGYRALFAMNGREAMALAKSHPLFAITLDLMMDGQDGWDVLHHLTHDPQTCSVPIIVSSVLDQRNLCLMLGAKLFLKKPIMREALLNALDGLKTSHQPSLASP
ncbi:MAG: response regulator [Anaerolineae bacterium]